MALRVWLPLNGTLENQGISNYSFSSSGYTIDNNGKIGKCYKHLNCNITNLGNLNIYPMTICFWMKTSDTSSTWQKIIMFDNSSLSQIHGIYVADSARVKYEYNPSLNVYNADIGNWHHYAFVINNNKSEAYYDGVLSITSTEAVTSEILGRIRIAEAANVYLNDLRIYDNCLSAKEIKEISRGLVLHYKLDNIIGNNFLINSMEATGQNESAYMVKSYNLTDNLINGNVYTIIAKLTASSDKKAWGVWVGGGSYPAGSMQQILNATDIYTWSFTANSNMEDKTFINVYVSNNNGTQGSTTVTGTAHVHWIKLEKGDISTGWGPSRNEAASYVPDSSGYDNDGIITGILETNSNTNRYEISTKFPTNTCYIKLPEITYSNFGNSYTFSWWEYITTNSGGPMPWGFSNGNRLNCYHTTNLCWNTGDGGGNPFTPTKTSASLIDNKWHHMVITGDGVTTKLYIDGTLWGNATTYKALTGTQIYISGWDTGTSYKMTGNSMVDFRIYATVLSADDIKDLYNIPANIDNLGNLHGFEVIESDNNKINKNGSIENKLFSSTIQLEDGSLWAPICIHNIDEGNNMFATTDNFSTTVYHSHDLWANFPIIDFVNRPENGYYEFLVKQQLTKNGNWDTYRFKQTVNPLTATWNTAGPTSGNVTWISGYTGSNYGGMYKQLSPTATNNNYMCFTNTSNGNWFGCGCKTLYQGGIPSICNTVPKGWQIVYIRVSKDYYKNYKVGITEATGFIEK